MGRFRPIRNQRDFDRMKRDVERQNQPHNRHNNYNSNRPDPRISTQNGTQRGISRNHEKYEKHVPHQVRENIQSTQPKSNFLKQVLQNYRDRNKPEKVRQRISELELKDREEKLKTSIYKSKSARPSGLGGLGGFSLGGSPGGSSKSGRSEKSKSLVDKMNRSSSGFGTSDVGLGLNEMFGTGGSQKSNKRSTQQSDGLRDMFG